MWPFSSSKKKRKVASLGYLHQGVLLILSIQDNGDVRLTIDTTGVYTTVPLQKPAVVHVILDKEALPVVKQWFGNISGMYTIVDADVKAIEIPSK